MATNLSRIEEALRESEDRFSNAFEHAAIGMGLVSPDGRWLKVNRALCELVGYSAEELLTKTFQDITHPDDLEADLVNVRQILAGEIRSYHMEKRYLHKRGDVVWILLSVSLVRDVEGQPRYFVSQVQDITERKRIELQIVNLNSDLERRILERTAQLEFESLLTGISTQLLNLPSESVDEEIANALRRFAEHLEMDRASIDVVDPSDGVLRTHFSWEGTGAASTLQRAPNEVDFPWAASQISAGRPVIFSRPEELPAEAAGDLERVPPNVVQSLALLPLLAAGRLIGRVHFSTVTREQHWPDTIVQRLRLIGEIFASVLLRREKELELRNALAQVQALTERLEAENAYLREDALDPAMRGDIVGDSAALQRVLLRVEQVAPTDASVLILGETGVGKELIAKAIHEKSRRQAATFVRVNCAALPATLIESELFGHEKGAFTGASARKLGRFELADNGTILLDEIGELPLELQAKLLHVLQDGEMQRLGSHATQKVNVRVIAATNRDLKAAVAAGTFRTDLYYRLAVFPIEVPPLRARKEDIPLLVWYFLTQLRAPLGKSIDSVPPSAMHRLIGHDWPGNIRELRNVIEHAMIISPGVTLQLDEAFDAARAQPGGSAPASAVALVTRSLEDVERAHIVAVLEACGWKIRGRGQAAERLGLHPSTLYSRMHKLGIQRPS